MGRPHWLIFNLPHDPVPTGLIEAMAPAVLVHVEAGSASMVVFFRNGNATVVVDSTQIDEVRLTCPRGDSSDLLMLDALCLASRLAVGRSVLLRRAAQSA